MTSAQRCPHHHPDRMTITLRSSHNCTYKRAGPERTPSARIEANAETMHGLSIPRPREKLLLRQHPTETCSELAFACAARWSTFTCPTAASFARRAYAPTRAPAPARSCGWSRSRCCTRIERAQSFVTAMEPCRLEPADAMRVHASGRLCHPSLLRAPVGPRSFWV